MRPEKDHQECPFPTRGAPTEPEADKRHPTQLVAYEPAPTQPEAYERAPTLMAGQAPGSQGQVRVWAPNAEEIWRAPGLWAPIALSWAVGSLAVFAACSLAGRPDLGARAGIGLFSALVMLLMGVGMSWRAARRPPYLTTDSAGIGITTWRGSEALGWQDITAVEYIDDYVFTRLVLHSHKRTVIYLLGFTEEQQQELLALVKDAAGLSAAPDKPRLFTPRR